MSKIPNIPNFPNIHNIAKYVGGGQQFEPYFAANQKREKRLVDTERLFNTQKNIK